jgi:hypothetical protein
MAAFDRDADVSEDLAYWLMINTPVTLYWRRELLDHAVTWLEQHGYHITRLDASRWQEDADLHRAVAETLDFPAYYGRNLDALRDCISDVIGHEYGWPAGTQGLVVTFTGYDAFARNRPRSAQFVLDILAEQARVALLFGERVMCLVQSDDPDIRFEAVGAQPVMWNSAEWLDANRHPRP